MDHDHVENILDEWRAERPDLDFSSMAVIARISRACRILERNIESVLARYGISESGFGVLAALRRAGPPFRLSPTALYNSLLISSGAMTNRLDRLAEVGLVSRNPDEGDRRSILVALTPKGRQIVDEALQAHTANELALLSSLSAEEKKMLATLLRKLLTDLEAPHPKAGEEPTAAS